MKQRIKSVAGHKVSLFALVGVLNTIADLILLNILRVATHTTSEESGKLILLNIISAGTVSMMSFYLNRRYVFKSEQTRNRMFAPFLIVTLSSIFIVQSLIIGLSLENLDGFSRWLMNLVQDLNVPVAQNFSFNFYEANVAKILATAGSMVWNYIWYNKVIFKDKS